MIVKARHQGHSTVLPIPKSIKAPANTEFNVSQDNNGTIIFRPIHKAESDLWSDSSLDNLDYLKLRREEQADLGYDPRELSPIGKEKPKDNLGSINTAKSK